MWLWNVEGPMKNVKCRLWRIKRITMTVEIIWYATLYEECDCSMCWIAMIWKWLPKDNDCHSWWKMWNAMNIDSVMTMMILLTHTLNKVNTESKKWWLILMMIMSWRTIWKSMRHGSDSWTEICDSEMTKGY